MQYLIVLSALLSLATAVMAQSAAATEESDEAFAMGSVGPTGNVSAPVADQDLADDYIE
jgi:methionine synthase I (cobalamin-dependent)